VRVLLDQHLKFLDRGRWSRRLSASPRISSE
jgi:hypothetical protein